MTHPILFSAIFIYLMNGSYLAGINSVDDPTPEGWREWGAHFLYILLVTVLGPICYWYQCILKASKELYHLLQVKFFFKLIFTFQFDNLSQEKLYGFNDVAAKYHRKDTFRDRVWRYAVQQLNIRNGYTFIPKPKTEEDQWDQ